AGVRGRVGGPLLPLSRPGLLGPDHAQDEVGVERADLLRGARAVDLEPAGHVDAQGEHREGGAVHVDDVELAGAGALLDDRAHLGVDLPAQFADLGAGVGAEGVQLVLHDPGRGAAAGVPADEGADRAREPLGGTALRAGRRPQHLEDLLVADPADAVEQLFLGLVVDVERGRAHAGAARDVPRRRRVVAALRERLDRGEQQPSGRVGCDLTPRLRLTAGRLLRRTHRSPLPLAGTTPYRHG